MRNTMLSKRAVILSMMVASAALVVGTTIFTGCEREAPSTSAPTVQEGQYAVPQNVLNEVDELRLIAAAPDEGLAYWTEDNTDNPPVVVPAGSVNALAAAIAAAGPNGKVILRSGLHTENSTVTVTSRVSIIGERGAILKSATTASNDLPTPVRPAIHVRDADRVRIWNIDFRPTGTVAGTAVLLENSPHSLVGENSIEGYQYPILLHYSASSTIYENSIVCAMGGTIAESDGIVNINGDGVRIVDNDVSNALLGVFCSGGNGFFLENKVHQSFVGMILCCVPDGSFLLPGGAIVGSDTSGHHWFVEGNTATGNLHVGYLVIDGANNNLLVNNRASGNADFDIELAGDTNLFGFCTPTCFNNKVIAGRQQGILINDFGLNNTVRGGNLVHVPIVPCP